MNIAIIGCGLIGQKRLRAMGKRHRLVVASDVILDRARSMIEQSAALSGERCENAIATSCWREAAGNKDADIVIVSTTNDCLAEIALFAVEAGKHVLVEKPGARTPGELDALLAATKKNDVCVSVGFNHRFHPAVQKARSLFEAGSLGGLMFIRARYGHGGRIGYDTEWRSNPELSGGGELIDQGVHLIDLSRWFLGDFSEVCGFAPTYFWQMPVDDNAFLLLKTAENQAAWLHASCTEWKNLFSFEVYGTLAKLHIEGLGGSYGTERLTYYRMLPEMGPPETTIWEFPGPDTSWQVEFEAFIAAVEAKKSSQTGTLNALQQKALHAPDIENARAVLKIVQQVYDYQVTRR